MASHMVCTMPGCSCVKFNTAPTLSEQYIASRGRFQKARDAIGDASRNTAITNETLKASLSAAFTVLTTLLLDVDHKIDELEDEDDHDNHDYDPEDIEDDEDEDYEDDDYEDDFEDDEDEDEDEVNEVEPTTDAEPVKVIS